MLSIVCQSSRARNHRNFSPNFHTAQALIRTAGTASGHARRLRRRRNPYPSLRKLVVNLIIADEIVAAHRRDKSGHGDRWQVAGRRVVARTMVDAVHGIGCPHGVGAEKRFTVKRRAPFSNCAFCRAACRFGTRTLLTISVTTVPSFLINFRGLAVPAMYSHVELQQARIIAPHHNKSIVIRVIVLAVLHLSLHG